MGGAWQRLDMMNGGVVNASAVAALYKIMNKTTEVGAGDGMIHQSKTNENANQWTKGVC